MVTIATSPREQMLNDLFTTGMEGGVGYWSQCSVYQWSDRTIEMNQINEFVAIITDIEDEDEPEYRIDAEVIRTGIARFYEHMRRLSQEGTANRYQWQAAKDMHHGKYDDLDFDADTADMVIQLGLLGEIRYG